MHPTTPSATALSLGMCIHLTVTTRQLNCRPNSRIITLPQLLPLPPAAAAAAAASAAAVLTAATAAATCAFSTFRADRSALHTWRCPPVRQSASAQAVLQYWAIKHLLQAGQGQQARFPVWGGRCHRVTRMCMHLYKAQLLRCQVNVHSCPKALLTCLPTQAHLHLRRPSPLTAAGPRPWIRLVQPR